MSRRLRTPWIRPVSVDPKLFVNRSADAQRLENLLGDRVDYKDRSGLVLVSGDRGIGKSIFCRAVIERVVKAHPKEAISVIVDARGADADTLIRRSAQVLVEAARAISPVIGKDKAWEQAWLAPLGELTNDRITRGASSQDFREYGFGSEIASGLWGVLQGKFSAQWKERREQGQRIELMLEVNSEIRRAAISALLAELSQSVTVILFLDDLDQAEGMDNAENAKRTLRTMLDLAPALTVVHLRSEVKFPDVRREHDGQVDLGPLQMDELELVLRTRLTGAHPPDKTLIESEVGWEPVRRLMKATGNPLVLLRWIASLAETSDVWPPPEWAKPEALCRLALHASGAPVQVIPEVPLLGQILDRLGRTEPVSEQELLDGRLKLDNTAAQGLSAAQIERLKRHELITQVDRFDPALGLRLDPLLELIRPSVARAVAEG